MGGRDEPQGCSSEQSSATFGTNFRSCKTNAPISNSSSGWVINVGPPFFSLFFSSYLSNVSIQLKYRLGSGWLKNVMEEETFTFSVKLGDNFIFSFTIPLEIMFCD